MTCPTDEELSALAEGLLDGPDRDRVQAHVADCEVCGQTLALLLRVKADGSAPKPSSAFDERYELRGELGKGAMGAVYSAYDRKLERLVALKWLRLPDGARPDQAHRSLALAEAKALAKLAHPNVVRVYDVLALDGDDVIAMEFLEGVTLRGWLDGAPRTREQILARLRECALGLGAAHAAGLVHRDFKPDNVLVGKDGVARVLDFGLSRDTGHASARLDDAAGLATVGSAGTPRYMAPEVLRGQRADARSDQYSWALAAFEALTRVAPLPPGPLGARLSAMDQRAFEREAAFVALPRRLRLALSRALDPERARRFDSMEDAARALALEPVGRLAVAAVIALLVAGAATVLVTRSQQRCGDAALPIAQTWDGARRAALAASLSAQDVPFAQAQARQAAALVDGWTDAWRDARVQLCRESQAQALPAALASARLDCLERLRSQLGAQLDALRALPVERAGSVLPALEAVPAPQRCLSAASLADVPPRPTDATAAAALAAAEAELDAAQAQLNLGLYAQAEAPCRALLDAARRLGFRPHLAAAAAQCGRLETAQGREDTARGLLHEALTAALGSNAHATAVTVAGLLAQNDGVVSNNRVAAEAWLTVGEAVAARAGLDASLERAGLLVILGDVTDQAGDYAAAARHRREALRLFEGLGRGASADAELLRGELGMALSSLGETTEAEALATRAMERLTTALGPSHPLALRALMAQSVVLGNAGKFDEALALREQELALKRGLYGDGHFRVVSVLVNVAELALIAERYELAKEAASQVLLRTTREPPTAVRPAFARRKLVEAQLALGEWNDGCALADTLAPPPGARTTSPEEAGRIAWIQARCAHWRTHDDAALREVARRVAPQIPPLIRHVRRQLDDALGGADAGAR